MKKIRISTNFMTGNGTVILERANEHVLDISEFVQSVNINNTLGKKVELTVVLAGEIEYMSAIRSLMEPDERNI